MPEIFVCPKSGETLVLNSLTAVKGTGKTVKLTVPEGAVSVAVYSDDPKTDPVFGLIDFREETSALGRIKLTAYSDGTYALVYRFKEPASPSGKPDYFVSANFKNNRVNFSAYGKNRPLIILTSGDESQTISPKKDLTDLKLMFQPSKSALLCVAKAKTDKDYMAVCSYDGVFRLLYEGEADEYAFSDDGFLETTKFKDLLGRVRKSFYTFTETGFRPIKEEFSYENAGGYDLASLPSLLLEATRAGDFSAAEKYLGPELKGKAPYLPEFFGSFCRYEKLPDGSYNVYDDGVDFGFVKPKVVNFSIKDRLIDNISIKD